MTTPAAPTPIDMVLYCPLCGLQHIDAAPGEASRTRKFFIVMANDFPHRLLSCLDEDKAVNYVEKLNIADKVKCEAAAACGDWGNARRIYYRAYDYVPEILL